MRTLLDSLLSFQMSVARKGLNGKAGPSGQARGQGCCPRNCTRRAGFQRAIVARREGGTRQRPASQETGRRRDCARASGGVYRCGGGEPAGGLSTLCRWRTRNAPVQTSRVIARKPNVIARNQASSPANQASSPRKRGPRIATISLSLVLWVPAFAGMTMSGARAQDSGAHAQDSGARAQTAVTSSRRPAKSSSPPRASPHRCSTSPPAYR